MLRVRPEFNITRYVIAVYESKRVAQTGFGVKRDDRTVLHSYSVARMDSLAGAGLFAVDLVYRLVLGEPFRDFRPGHAVMQIIHDEYGAQYDHQNKTNRTDEKDHVI